MNCRSVLSAAFVAVVLLSLAACDDSSPAGSTGDARLSIYLTDAPGDIVHVWVEVLSISFRSGGEEFRFTPEDDELIDLAALTGEAQLIVDEQEIEPGPLTEIRIVIGAGVLEAASGEVYVLGNPLLPLGLLATGTLQCPSCQQSGIKVKIAGDGLDLEEGSSALLLDIDVAQTFGHRAGNSGMWVMHPVIRGALVVDEDDDGTAEDEIEGGTGRVEGSVEIAAGVNIPQCPTGTERTLEDFVPTATATTLLDGDGEPIVGTGIVDSEGRFTIGGLEADVYAFAYLDAFDYGSEALTFTATVSPPDVVVSQASSASVLYTITGAACGPTS